MRMILRYRRNMYKEYGMRNNNNYYNYQYNKRLDIIGIRQDHLLWEVLDLTVLLGMVN